VHRPADWQAWVNEPQLPKEIEALRESAAKGKPFGDPAWCEQTAKRLNLQSSCRKTGRPKMQAKEEKA
jgi:hypothetical protein